MLPELSTIKSTVTILVRELQRRFPEVEENDRYYRGEHNLAFASDQFRSYMNDRYKGFRDNWCGVVADAPVERLEVTGIRPAGMDRGSDDELWADWIGNECDVKSDMAFLEAGIGKRAHCLVWGDADANPLITWEHPSQSIVSYDAESGARAAGLKFWRDDTQEFATLYMPDYVWKFQRSRIQDGRTESGLYVSGGDFTGWNERQPASDDTWPIANPLGEVPLVEIANRPRLLGEPMSDIHGTKAMQNAINLMWAYLLNAADHASFPQRVVMGADIPQIPVLDENGQKIDEKDIDIKKFGVDRVFWLTDENARIGSWPAADLSIFTGVLDVMTGHLASQTRTPPHYLMAKTPNMSGDGLKAAETGLIQRSKEKTTCYGLGVREANRLVARVRGEEKKAEAVRRGRVLWRDVESRSEAQAADAALKLRQIGFPIEYICQRLNLSPTEIADVLAQRKDEQQSQSLLEQVAASFQQPGAGGGDPNPADGG